MAEGVPQPWGLAHIQCGLLFILHTTLSGRFLLCFGQHSANTPPGSVNTPPTLLTAHTRQHTRPPPPPTPYKHSYHSLYNVATGQHDNPYNSSDLNANGYIHNNVK